MRVALIVSAVLLGGAAPLQAQTALLPVDEVEWVPFRHHCRALLRALDEAKAPLPNAGAVRELLDREPTKPDDAVSAVQRLLDAHCLLGVHINPESRVKAARGPLPAELVRGKERIVLVRVHNEGGVRSALAVSGLGVVGPGQPEEGAWLEATASTLPSMSKNLSGRRLEYVPMHLKARDEGKREATLRFDVGQGTQDLGFRAEVPILFVVRAP
jgi:hypothetical protein